MRGGDVAEGGSSREPAGVTNLGISCVACTARRPSRLTPPLWERHIEGLTHTYGRRRSRCDLEVDEIEATHIVCFQDAQSEAYVHGSSRYQSLY